MTFRLRSGPTGLEQAQLEQRARALGMEIRREGGEPVVDTPSLVNVAGGAEAVAAVAKDGVLDADALATLRRRTGVLGGLLRQDEPMSATRSRQVRAAAMSLHDVANETRRATKAVLRSHELVGGETRAVNARVEEAVLRVVDVLDRGLGNVDAGAARALAHAIGDLSRATSSHAHALSHARSAVVANLVVDAHDAGGLVDGAHVLLVAALDRSLELNQRMAQAARLLADRPANIAATSEQVQTLAAQLRGGA